MTKFLCFATAAVLALPALHAFDFKVRSIERVPVQGTPEAFHPVFSNDGHSLLVTSEAFQGLGIVNIADGSFRHLTDRAGAGYKFAQSSDGSRILLRENDFITQKIALYTLDVASATEDCVIPVAEHTNSLAFTGDAVLYAEPVERKMVRRNLRTPLTKLTPAPATFLNEEDLKLVLYTDGTRTVVDPILDATGRDVNYCWSSISPDGTRLLFVAGNDAFTSNLDGSDLVSLGTVHAPVWRDNNTVIAMLDTDDGHFFTTSDIVAVDARTGRRMQLTPKTDDIKMFPAVSPDGNRIAYHTTKGQIYIINLENN